MIKCRHDSLNSINAHEASVHYREVIIDTVGIHQLKCTVKTSIKTNFKLTSNVGINQLHPWIPIRLGFKPRLLLNPLVVHVQKCPEHLAVAWSVCPHITLYKLNK